MRARVGLSLFFIFTSIGHFIKAEEMSAMLPPFVPYRIQNIYLTGVLEILGAIGVWIAPLMTLTRFRLILMLMFSVLARSLRTGEHRTGSMCIHRRIGLTGGLLASNLLRQTARRIPATEAAQLNGSTQKPMRAKCPESAPCPGRRNCWLIFRRSPFRGRLPPNAIISARADRSAPSLRHSSHYPDP
jgi:uncharacterized membrane protein